MAMTPTHDAFYDLKKRHLEAVSSAGQPGGGLLGLNGSPTGMANGGSSLNGANGMFPNGHLGEYFLYSSPVV